MWHIYLTSYIYILVQLPFYYNDPLYTLGVVRLHADLCSPMFLWRKAPASNPWTVFQFVSVPWLDYIRMRWPVCVYGARYTRCRHVALFSFFHCCITVSILIPIFNLYCVGDSFLFKIGRRIRRPFFINFFRLGHCRLVGWRHAFQVRSNDS